MSHLLDTDFVTDYLNGRVDALALFEQLAPDGLGMSIISHSEVYEGILGSNQSTKRTREFRTFLRAVRILPFNITVSRRYAQLRKELRDNKRQINERALDLMIAATALAYDMDLVTGNTRHYRDIPGLRIINPRRPYPTANGATTP